MNHPLAAWIDANTSRVEFARAIKINKSHLSLILQGKRGMSLKVAARIEAETGGEFTAGRLLQEQQAMMQSAEAAE